MIVATGSVTTKCAIDIINSCEAHFYERGMNCTRKKPRHLLMDMVGGKIEMHIKGDAINIRIETPTENHMIFIRDALVEHISSVDSQTSEKLTWFGGIRTGDCPSNFYTLRAVKRSKIFPGLIRVTLQGEDVAKSNQGGIHIKLMMPQQRGQTPIWPVLSETGRIQWPKGENQLHARFVTIRNIRLDQSEIDVDIACHKGGLISDWASMEEDENPIGIMGPGGSLAFQETENIILAGDITALPAFARLIEIAEGKVSGHLFAAAPSTTALKQYLPESNLKITAFRPDEFADQIVSQIKGYADQSINYAWFAGEYSAARALRSVFKKEFGFERHQFHSTAYWRKGETDFEP